VLLRKFGLAMIIVVLIASLIACPTNPPDDDPSLEMVTLSGVFAGIVEEGFLLIATDTVSGFTYTTAVGDDGSFNLEVPKDNSCIYSVVDENGRARGVMVFADNTRSVSRGAPPPTEVTTGMKLTEDHTLSGAITLPSDSAPGKIELEIDPDLLDDSVTAREGDGELLGFGSGSDFGKAGFTFKDVIGDGGKADPDGDGLPSVIDADDDGDGIPDDWDKDADGDGVIDTIEAADTKPDVDFFLGFLLDIRENSGVYSYDPDNPLFTTTSLEGALRRDMRVDFQVRFQNATDFASVESVRLYKPSSPTYAEFLDAVEFAFEPGSTTNFREYTMANGYLFDPATASIAWADFTDGTGDGYNIPENISDPNTFTVSVKIPQANPDLFEVGDIFTIEIVYADGSVEYLSQMINYTYTNGTHFQGYTLTIGDSPYVILGDYTNFNFSTNTPNQIVFDDNTDDTVQFTFIPPKDEHGDYIIPDEADGSADSGFRIELFSRLASPPVIGADVAGWNPEHKRFDSMLSDLARIDDGDDVYFVGLVPLDYLKALVDLEADPVIDTFEMEYFLNFTTDSYIKNRLTFKLVNDIPD
jgi:hypothetical protein